MYNIENKNKRNVHEQLFDEDTKVVNYPKTKKNKFEDRYSRTTLYVQNDTLAELNRRAGTEKGEKTRIVNEALQEYFRRNK